MANLNTLNDLFIYELQELYSIERQQINVLALMADATETPALKAAFENHMEDTIGQKERLEYIFNILRISHGNLKNEEMTNLGKEWTTSVANYANSETKNAALIAAAHRIEHYEMAEYETAYQYAHKLGYNEIADLLHQTYEEEKQANIILNIIAKRSVYSSVVSEIKNGNYQTVQFYSTI